MVTTMYESPTSILQEQIPENRSREMNKKTGRWLINPDGYYPYCSKCGEEPKCRVMTKFCPECGSYNGGNKIE